ncbi:glycoside hydrolase family 28 protein [Collybiopsis luxurians FD-317 M1]|uniref:Glycoside hydrolase family 28 protein n=1 Tax=Collybiopsis luxurians FD-317 M1 TaxID=944289 RepID=A0A0D0BJ97_9AGAR|nr:glycoside hydrolase family 28 protein [Collybiopsis luxurians FD-317 M1]
MALSSILSLLSFLLYFIQLDVVFSGTVQKEGTICTVRSSINGSDDAPAILQAFQMCGTNGVIQLHDPLYHIETVMNTTGLSNVQIDLNGTMLWGTNLTYWRASGLPLGYDNFTTAWVLGGDQIVFDGHGVGTFDGNGQLWYNLANGVSNFPGRPISLMISNSTNSHYTGIRFVQSQFWTMAIKDSEDVLLENIYINSTSNNSVPARNTDGVDTLFSNRITFRNWTVVNGDDCISLKANSTNILIQDSVFHGGLGVSIGSIGQLNGVFEMIQSVTAERILAIGSRYAGYVKTWTGVQQGFPPNGGGGGIGFATNITFRDFTLQNLTENVAMITQCTSFEGATGDCDTSLFQLSNITWGPGITGSIQTDTLATMQCSGDAPCPGISLLGFNEVASVGAREIKCSNVVDPVGFNCTGPT